MSRKRSHCKELPKSISASVVGLNMGTNNQKKDPKLVGETNEVSITIGDTDTTALLDSGSCISAISYSYWKENLANNYPLQPLQDIINLKIECADGQKLPYLGYIETELKISHGLPKASPLHCLFLITPDTNYSSRTPVIIGTNILSELLQECKQNFGPQFIQKAGLHTPWFLAFRCITYREKELKRNKSKVAIVRCAEPTRIILGPNESRDILGETDKELEYGQTTAIIHETEDSVLPDFIDITPGIVNYDKEKNRQLIITVSNLTTNSVVISPRSILCELQPVKIEDKIVNEPEDNSFHDVIGKVTIDTSNYLTEDQHLQIKALLLKHIDIFSKNDTDIGHCTKVKHRIDLVDDIPFKQRHRRIPPHMIEEVRNHLENLLSAGIIQKSKSPWASNIVLVRKKNGSLRVCIDYRQLNSKSVKDSYSLPRIEEVFDVLHGSKYFSTLDMKSGYHQVEVEETHRERTAFTAGPLGFFEYVKMPFGLANSPATYQRLMEECLGDYNMTICVIYLDDLIIFADTFEEHLDRLDKVLTRLKECELKLSPEKCFFIQEKVKFLGHVISKEGIETNPDKIDKIRKWPTPKNSDELRSFLAFAGYYRRFIRDFSKITKPLADLIPGTSTKKHGKKEHKEWIWTDKEQEIFDDLKQKLTSPPILTFPDFTKEFELHTDASAKALGAVLYQDKKVVAYASRSLTKSECNYSAYKLEFLALKWAVTEKFADYLALKHFTVLTDNNPLTYILTTAKLDATGQRWASALGEFDFDLIYRPGLRNTDADAMSRYPYERLNTEEVKIENSTVKTICSSITSHPLIEVIPSASINILEATETPGAPMAQLEIREIRQSQRQDKLIERWRRAVIDKYLPDKNQCWTREDMFMRKNFHSLKMVRGILYREVKGETIVNQLVLPQCYRKMVLKGLHSDIGHPGRDRTLSLLRERYFWPGMASDVEKWVSTCERCIRRKSSTNIKSELVNIVTTYPLELVSMDYLTLEPSRGHGNILVITDHFTKYALAIPTKNQTAKTTAEAFYNHFIVNYGIPTKLHTDQGANFESDLIKELCNITGMKKTRTTPYHAMGNGCTERWNKTLLDMLGTLEPSKKPDWKNYIPSLVYAYNCTRHESTKTTPFELMFGRKPKLPIDAVFETTDLEQPSSKTTKEYIQDLKNRMKTTQEIAKKYTDKAREKQKKQYDKRATASRVSVGDKVLVKVLAFDGKHKIADKFEEDIYEVTEQPREEIPVFKIRSQNGVEKILHRNHLLPIQTTDGEDDTEEKKIFKPVPKKRQTKLPVKTEKVDMKGELDVPPVTDDGGDVTSDSEESDSGDEYVSYTYKRGDAHKPGNEKMIDSIEESISDDQGTVNEMEDAEIEDSGEIKAFESEHGSHTDNLEVHDSATGADTSVKRIGRGVRLKVIETDSKDKSTETKVTKDDEKRKMEGTLRKEPEKMKRVTLSRRTEKTKSSEREPTEQSEKRPKPAPRDPVRKSERSKKLPVRYQDYEMNLMVPKPPDYRLHALDVFINSGVFNYVDPEVAKKVINAVMQ